MTEYSCDYGQEHSLKIPCILYEGAITVTSTTRDIRGEMGEPTFAFASEVSQGDLVALFVDTANTFTACKGLPVVQTLADTEGIIGKVHTTPQWMTAPTATTGTWATDIAAGHYRVATVEFFGVNRYIKMLCDGELTVGAPLVWDISADGFKDNGTTFTGQCNAHYAAAASNANSGILFGWACLVAGGSDADVCGGAVTA